MVTSSATFWWITELANLVKARRLRSAEASTSASGAAAVASSTATVARCSSGLAVTP